MTRKTEGRSEKEQGFFAAHIHKYLEEECRINVFIKICILVQCGTVSGVKITINCLCSPIL